MAASSSISGRFMAMATLWQNRLLRLLASKDRAATLFQKRMVAFPLTGKPKSFCAGSSALDGTIDALQSSMRYKGTEQGGTGRCACRTGQALTVPPLVLAVAADPPRSYCAQ